MLRTFGSEGKLGKVFAKLDIAEASFCMSAFGDMI